MTATQNTDRSVCTCPNGFDPRTGEPRGRWTEGCPMHDPIVGSDGEFEGSNGTLRTVATKTLAGVERG